MAISISASNLNPQAEELVEIYISRSIPENVGVWAYVNGVEKATWTVPPNGNLTIIPSMLGTTITFNAEGLASYERSNTLILTVQGVPTCPTGYHWDVATNSCVIDTPPPPVTPINMWIAIGAVSIVAVIGAILLLRKH